jgi:succinate dehydrogenase / fumarate reductase membrane anchor subunit
MSGPGVPSGGVQVGRSGRVRPRGDRRELVIWYLMRITGLLLFVLVLTHYLILHVLWDPAEQHADWIAEVRWSSLFWRVFDWIMLTCVMFHAFVGMRIVVSDMTTGTRRRVLLYGLYALAILLFILGTHVVVTLPNVVPQG